MHRRLALSVSVLLAAALSAADRAAAAAAATPVVTSDARLELSIDSPEPGAVVGDPGGMAFIAGKALAHFGEFQTFDIVFVIDVSDSTAAPSGADIDGDGVVGEQRGGPFAIVGQLLRLGTTDSGDTVLAAEIAAVRVLLDQLDPRTTRVGIVGFSGDQDPFTPDAYAYVPLTTDYKKVAEGLDEILDHGPTGRTNMVQGVLTGTVELLGTQSAYSTRREGARRIMMFLTDGQPTLPLESSRNQNARMAITAAKRAAKQGIRIDTYAIGPTALDRPLVTVEMAYVTKGVFTPVREPRNLQAVFEEVSFAEIEELQVRNSTTDQVASYANQNADGTFSALVPMREGVNTVEVYARSTDGTEARRRLDLKFLADAGVQELSPRLLAQRNRLMENRLMDLRRKSMEIREDLKSEIAREREAAEQRAEEERKALELEVEE